MRQGTTLVVPQMADKKGGLQPLRNALSQFTRNAACPSIPRPLRNGWDTHKRQDKQIFSDSPVPPSKRLPNMDNLRDSDFPLPILHSTHGSSTFEQQEQHGGTHVIYSSSRDHSDYSRLPNWSLANFWPWQQPKANNQDDEGRPACGQDQQWIQYLCMPSDSRWH